MSKFTLSLVGLFMLSVSCCSLVSTASAATVAYWRFEDSPGFFQDSSGNGRTLTGGGLNEASHQSPIPGSGDGSAFLTTIPLTGEPNAFLTDNSPGARYASVPDSDDFTPGAFTIEAFINRDAAGSYRMFAAQWGAGLARSWAAGVTDVLGTSMGITEGNADRLKLFLGNVTGTAFTAYEAPTSDFDLAINKDYYVALSWDGSEAGIGNEGITFHIKNLTDNTPLVSASLDHTVATLHNSNQPITVGANTSTGANPWTGWLDEVRFSNTVLPIDQLLITAPFVAPEPLPAPEPSTMVLAVCGLALAARRRRRK